MKAFILIPPDSFDSYELSKGFSLAKENIAPLILDEAESILDNTKPHLIKDGFLSMQLSLRKLQSWLKVA